MKKRFVFVLLVALLGLGACKNRGWQSFESDEGCFSASFPWTPTQQLESPMTAYGVLQVHFFIVEQEDKAYSVSYADYPEQAVAGVDPGLLLNGIRDVAVSSVNGKIVTEQDIELSGYPGRELLVEISKEIVIARARIYVVENRFYVVQALCKSAQGFSKDTDKFLDSFQLKP